MLRATKPERRLAIALAALAGFVDAIGFVALGGFFVSFMSGNSTRLAVGVADLTGAALTAAGLIGAFLGGVVAGSVAGQVAAQRWRRPAVLGLVAALLALAVLLGGAGLEPVALGLVAAAMGAENAVFERDGEVAIGLTYMTGTLVKFGQRVAAALLRRGPWAAALPYLLLWLGLVGGAIVGALAYGAIGFPAIGIAAVAAAVMALVSIRMRPA